MLFSVYLRNRDRLLVDTFAGRWSTGRGWWTFYSQLGLFRGS